MPSPQSRKLTAAFDVAEVTTISVKKSRNFWDWVQIIITFANHIWNRRSQLIWLQTRLENSSPTKEIKWCLKGKQKIANLRKGTKINNLKHKWSNRYRQRHKKSSQKSKSQYKRLKIIQSWEDQKDSEDNKKKLRRCRFKRPNKKQSRKSQYKKKMQLKRRKGNWMKANLARKTINLNKSKKRIQLRRKGSEKRLNSKNNCNYLIPTILNQRAKRKLDRLLRHYSHHSSISTQTSSLLLLISSIFQSTTTLGVDSVALDTPAALRLVLGDPKPYVFITANRSRRENWS